MNSSNQENQNSENTANVSSKSMTFGTDDLVKEKQRVLSKKRFHKSIRSTIGFLLCSAAVAVLIANFIFPVVKIRGVSMTPTLEDNDIVVSLRGKDFNTGDVIGFYYNNNLLIKRVIAGPGDWVDMDLDGNVYVNGELLDEPYIEEKAYGNTNQEFPYQVPQGSWFVMGDDREVSLDSRNTAIGTINDEEIVGALILKIWPFESARLF